MNLHIHHYAWELNKEYVIYDDTGRGYYYARSGFLSGCVFTVYDWSNNTVSSVRPRFGIQPTRIIEIDNIPFKLLTKWTLPPELFCFIEHTGYSICGYKYVYRISIKHTITVRDPRYWVYYGQQLIMYLELNKNTSSDKEVIYDLTILDRQHERMCVSLAISLMF